MYLAREIKACKWNLLWRQIYEKNGIDSEYVLCRPCTEHFGLLSRNSFRKAKCCLCSTMNPKFAKCLWNDDERWHACRLICSNRMLGTSRTVVLFIIRKKSSRWKPTAIPTCKRADNYASNIFVIAFTVLLKCAALVLLKILCLFAQLIRLWVRENLR